MVAATRRPLTGVEDLMADASQLSLLKKGIKARNEWRLEHEPDQADVIQAHLRRVNLSGADLSKANLNGANLSEADLSGANLSEADLGGANPVKADLNGGNLSWAKLTRANLI
jgi:uncharacterized protein YjbI with pentapeptide repeats